jgi:hypothetical protein
MIKYWMYYVVGALLLFHPHLAQKFNMLIEYFSHSEYEFWTTFSAMDIFDLALHAGLPLVMFFLGAKKQFSTSK